MPDEKPNQQEELLKLLKENLEYNKAIYKMSKKTKKFILTLQIMSIVKLLLIVVPVILAIIYLPSLLQNWIGPYQELLGQSGQGSSILNQLKELKTGGEFKNLLK
ncbi:hypothetical protein KKD19_02310 [Patescibacteria group bacterium]|nr:hypothetical protein [Patescibacteria group bacterium]MBU4512058.1 hypothetical protein [Patescibacteria group bacterium]MCG2692686.1 hypothetical protein [Candidatus Parcubacteria bacterium]